MFPKNYFLAGFIVGWGRFFKSFFFFWGGFASYFKPLDSKFGETANVPPNALAMRLVCYQMLSLSR
jgi:hypothetical protein